MALFESGRQKSGGRRAGVRNKISTAMMEDFLEDYAAFGKEAWKIVRKEDPQNYLKLGAHFIPTAFDDEAPLGLAITNIQRTIIDSPAQLEPVPQTVRVAAPEVVREEKVKSELTKLLESSEP
jgi:hypothetical protein